MKKILALVAAMAFGAAAFAGDWQSTVGAGFTLPVTNYGFDEDDVDSQTQIGYGFDLMYLGVHLGNGFTAKVDASIGLASNDDIPDGDAEDPLELTANLGFGYSFIRDEKVTLAALGVVGIDYTWFGSKSNGVDVDFSYFSLNVGASILGAYRFTDHFGAFADLSLRYIVTGTASAEYPSPIGTQDVDISGNIVFRPTLGVIWTF